MALIQPPFPKETMPGGNCLPFSQWQDKTANYTIVTGDNGTCFTNKGAAGAVTFTLPLLAANYIFGFYVDAAQSVTVTTNSGDGAKIIAFNNRAVTNVAITTGGAQIGGALVFLSRPDAAAWYLWNQSAGAVTLTLS